MSAKVTERWLLIFVIGVCAVPLLIVAFGSFYMRYMADDFCNSAAVAELGWLRFVLNTYTGWTGTFSGLAFQGITPRAEWLGLPIMLALSIWALLLYIAIYVLLRRGTAVKENIRLFAAAAAVLLLAGFVCVVPSLHESLFWYGSAAPYTFSLVLSTLYVPLILGFRKTGAILILFGFSFFLAGFSVTFTALQIFSLCFFLILLRHKQTIRRRLLASLLGALAGAAVLLVAPGNAVRASVANVETDLLFTIIYLPRVMLYLFAFIIYKTPLIALSMIGIPFLISHYYRLKFQSRISPVLIAWLLMLGSAAAAFAPVIYASSTWLLPRRTWTAPVWIVLCGTAALGYLYALAFRKQERPLGYLPRPARVIIAILAVGFLLNGLPIALEAVSRQAAYAAAWDERDTYLRSLSSTTEIVRARSFHGAFDLEDLTDDPNFWTNVCIARYYNLPAIVSDGQPPFVP
jgi:hypothetical protein